MLVHQRVHSFSKSFFIFDIDHYHGTSPRCLWWSRSVTAAASTSTRSFNRIQSGKHSKWHVNHMKMIEHVWNTCFETASKCNHQTLLKFRLPLCTNHVELAHPFSLTTRTATCDILVLQKSLRRWTKNKNIWTKIRHCWTGSEIGIMCTYIIIIYIYMWIVYILYLCVCTIVFIYMFITYNILHCKNRR